MTFENSKYSKLLDYRKLEFHFGNVFITKQFILSELNEGIHVDFAMVSKLISRFSEDISNDIRIGYIANRMNSYSFEPQLWLDFNNDYNFLVASAVVNYSDFGYLNSRLEKHFFKKKMKRCHSLDEAIEWMIDIEELKQNTSFK